MRLTLGHFEAIAAVALAVWSALGILPVHGEPISTTPVGLKAGDPLYGVGIVTAVDSEWMPKGTTLATILAPPASAIGTGTLLALVEHHGDGAATAFDMMWIGSATESGAVDLGRIGAVGAAVHNRSFSTNARWTAAGGAETSVSTRLPLSGVSR